MSITNTIAVIVEMNCYFNYSDIYFWRRWCNCWNTIKEHSRLSVWNSVHHHGYDLSAVAQLETKTGKAAATLSASEAVESADLKVALKREREEHQHLLAESYAAVMDLTKQVACSVNVITGGSESRIWCCQHSAVCATPSDVYLSSQLQIGERNWGREKLELLERFSQERAQWEQRLREATSQQGMVIPECVCVIRRRSEIRSDVLT